MRYAAAVSMARPRHARGRARAWGALLLAAALPGCGEDYDPLDPAVLAAVARSRGDARGQALGGFYVGRFEALECGCADVFTDIDVEAARLASLCTLIEEAEGLGLDDRLDVELVQADGTARAHGLRLGGLFQEDATLLPVLYGALEADGTISVAGVLTLDVVFAQGQVLGRFDGTLHQPDGAPLPTLEVEYQQRYVADLAVEAEDLPEGSEGILEAVDCRERIGLSLTWEAPLDLFELPGGDDGG